MAIKQKQPHQPTRAAMSGTHAANASATKRGPGRYHRGGKAGNRLTKARKPRAYMALCEAWAQKRVINWNGPRDEHGAFTLVGRTNEAGDTPINGRRVWLAGISAQRGY